MRYDLEIIASWIKEKSKVLGLGCGEGELLYFLKNKKKSTITGIEIDESKVAVCIEKGLSVLQGDINEEVLDYPPKSFDYVILSRTLQQIYKPFELINSILKIGKKAIVSFPNFSHWTIRTQLMFLGRAPVSNQLPYEWYNTPNIRVITIKDFRKFTRKLNLHILKETAINTQNDDKTGKIVKLFANIRGSYGIFLIEKK
ncbi:MAG: methionine biosynthesis protein MetW [Deltaproteobacteria bacterium]|nr:methionine biosynthesis protein MetW [Deltaproteobacteria bacterium]